MGEACEQGRRTDIQNHGEGNGTNQEDVLRPGPLRMGGGIIFLYGSQRGYVVLRLFCRVLLR